MTPSLRLRRLASRLQQMAKALDDASTAPACPTAVETALLEAEGRVAVLASLLEGDRRPAPAKKSLVTRQANWRPDHR